MYEEDFLKVEMYFKVLEIVYLLLLVDLLFEISFEVVEALNIKY